MHDIFVRIITLAYGAMVVVEIFAYWPTIHDLWLHKKPSANLYSYVLWTIATGISFLYSIFVLPDFLFRVISGVLFAANAVVILLVLRLYVDDKK